VTELDALGWDDAWQAQANGRDVARVVAEHRGAYRAHGIGGVAWCELPGRTFHRADDKRALPTVGDWIVVERWQEALRDDGAAIVRDVLPRRSLLVRRAAGEATAPQPLAANVDLGVVMTSANADFSPARLDRYLGLLRDGGVAALVVVSKIDLVDAGDAAALVARVSGLGISVVTGAGLDELRARVGPARTAVLLGSSGVGKSSLLNSLCGDDVQPVRPIDDDDRGRHTTTRRELFRAADGSLWIDTPGMRELARWADDDDDDDDAFDDIAELADACRFRDCRHDAEPGCAVRDAVDPARLASFRKLFDERATGAADRRVARRLAETRAAKAKRYTPRPGKPEE
jgi:ribosome biogenesis GTPase